MPPMPKRSAAPAQRKSSIPKPPAQGERGLADIRAVVEGIISRITTIDDKYRQVFARLKELEAAIRTVTDKPRLSGPLAEQSDPADETDAEEEAEEEEEEEEEDEEAEEDEEKE
jgi:hypothetical protein